MVDAVCADIQRAQKIYNKLFYRWILIQILEEVLSASCHTEAIATFVFFFYAHSAVKVDFFSISYRQLEKQVCH